MGLTVHDPAFPRPIWQWNSFCHLSLFTSPDLHAQCQGKFIVLKLSRAINTQRQHEPESITIIYHPLLGQDHEKPVHFKHTHPRRDHHRHLASSVKVAVDIVLVKHLNKSKKSSNEDVMAYQQPATGKHLYALRDLSIFLLLQLQHSDLISH